MWGQGFNQTFTIYKRFDVMVVPQFDVILNLSQTYNWQIKAHNPNGWASWWSPGENSFYTFRTDPPLSGSGTIDFIPPPSNSWSVWALVVWGIMAAAALVAFQRGIRVETPESVILAEMRGDNLKDAGDLELDDVILEENG